MSIVEPPPSEPRPDIALLFLPGIIMMALLFAAQGLSADYWKERDAGTLRRLVAAPGLMSRFVYGKALAAAVVLVVLAAITLSVDRRAGRITFTDWHTSGDVLNIGLERSCAQRVINAMISRNLKMRASGDRLILLIALRYSDAR